MKKLYRGAHALLMLVAYGMTLGTARADIIDISDFGDGIPTVASNSGTGISILANGPEFVHFTYASQQTNGASTATFVQDLLEADRSVSDRFIITQTNGSNLLDIQFYSDPGIPPIPQGAVVLDSFPEDGSFQTVFLYFGGGAQATDNFRVLSDVGSENDPGAVPEPGSLTLLGLGAIGLLGYASRRRKQAV